MYTKKIDTLDLNAFIEQYMEVALPDGDVIQVRKPTKEIVILIGELGKNEETKEMTEEQKAEIEEQKEQILKTIVSKGLNNNIEHKYVDISEWPDSMIVGALNGYLVFLNKVMSKNR